MFLVGKALLYGWMPSLQASVSIAYVIDVMFENVRRTFACFNVQDVLTGIVDPVRTAQ